jgi:hypothetical protein
MVGFGTVRHGAVGHDRARSGRHGTSAKGRSQVQQTVLTSTLGPVDQTIEDQQSDLWAMIYKQVANETGTPTPQVQRFTGPAAEAVLTTSGINPTLATELANTSLVLTRDGRAFTHIPHPRGKRLRDIAPHQRQLNTLTELLNEIETTELAYVAAQQPVPWQIERHRTITTNTINTIGGLIDRLLETAAQLPGAETIPPETEIVARRSLRALERSLNQLPPQQNGYTAIIGIDPGMMLNPTAAREAGPGMGTLQINPNRMNEQDIAAAATHQPVAYTDLPLRILNRMANLGDTDAADQIIRDGLGWHLRQTWNSIRTIHSIP